MTKGVSAAIGGKIICAERVSSYVGDMNWQQFLLLAVVLTVAVVFVWRSSGSKKTDGGCDCCGCSHGHEGSQGKTPAKK